MTVGSVNRCSTPLIVTLVGELPNYVRMCYMGQAVQEETVVHRV